MAYLLAGIGLVLLVWALIWIGINASASRVVRWLKWGMIAFVVGVIIGLLAMGFFRQAMFPGLMLIPMLLPWRKMVRPASGGDDRGGPHRHRSGGTMTFVEAAEILGVAPDASDDEIRDAHRKLMTANHPDKGGSPWFASQINQARDTMLGA